MSITVIVNVPFDGFYESDYSKAIDWEEERHIEDRCNESDHDEDESNWPESLRLDESELAEIFMRATDYRAAYLQIARDYVAAFDYMAGEAFGLSVADARNRYNYETNDFEKELYRRPSIRMAFESMDSPREYNFTTDRLYAHVPLAIMRHLFKQSKAEKHATLADVIAERFTSRDGFISHYSRHLADWLEKPFADWDHNEFGTLLVAALRMAGADIESSDTRSTLYESTIGDEGAYSAWESAVDWSKLESLIAEKRAEKLSEWLESDKESVLAWRNVKPEAFDALLAAEPELFRGLELPEGHYRCLFTLDMFEGEESRHA